MPRSVSNERSNQFDHSSADCVNVREGRQRTIKTASDLELICVCHLFLYIVLEKRDMINNLSLLPWFSLVLSLFRYLLHGLAEADLGPLMANNYDLSYDKYYHLPLCHFVLLIKLPRCLSDLITFILFSNFKDDSHIVFIFCLLVLVFSFPPFSSQISDIVYIHQLLFPTFSWLQNYTVYYEVTRIQNCMSIRT